MMNRRFLGLLSVLLVTGVFLTGCTSRKASSKKVAELEESLEDKDREISSLESSMNEIEEKLGKQEAELAKKSRELSEAEKAIDASKTASKTTKTDRDTDRSMKTSSALPDATVGECYTKVWVPPVYDTDETKVLNNEASERLEITPASYEWAEEKVLVKETSTKKEVVPATYEWTEEKVLETPAHTVWKKGRGAIEKVDNTTGEIMCLIEVPASYKTVKKRVLKSPATTREVTIPAEYKTVKVRKLATPEKIVRIPVNAEYTTVTTRSLVSEGRMEWRPVLCETNMTRDVISDLQRALDKAGHSPGPIDGIYGRQTRAAVRSYQQAKGLPSGGLTVQTLESLGVRN